MVRSKGVRVAAVAVAASAIATAAQAANIVGNSGFETGALSPWYQDRDFEAAGVDWAVNAADARSGAYSAVGEGNQEIRQDFAAVVGSSISEISFWLRHPTMNAGAFVSLFYADNTSSDDLVITHTDGWEFFDITYLMDTSKLLVGFSIFGYSSTGVGDITRLDDLVIDGRFADPIPNPDPVPEPSAWALMLAGFGLLGAALRTRRTVIAA